ncbi:surface protease GP63, partial [Trypanosoma rangeli]
KVKVKYLGGSGFEPCPEGGEIQVTASEHFKDGGKIKCPRYEEVCTVAANGSGFIFKWGEVDLQRASAGSPHTSSNGGLPRGREMLTLTSRAVRRPPLASVPLRFFLWPPSPWQCCGFERLS